MYKSGSLLLASILAVVLIAPPVRSQSTKEQLNDVTKDLIELKAQVKALQDSADKKNAEMKTALDQVVAKFATIDSSIQKLGPSLSAIQTIDQKSAADLQEARATVKAIKDNLDKLDLGQTLLDIKNGMAGLKTELKNMQNTETALPTSRQAFDSAYGLLSQGFYNDAISEFQDFLKAYPKDTRAAKGQLYIANAYSSQKKFEQALIEYDRTIQTYPESDTKCTALLKKGLTHNELKQSAQAKETFQIVVKECPNTDESNLAAAELKKPAPARGRAQ